MGERAGLARRSSLAVDGRPDPAMVVWTPATVPEAGVLRVVVVGLK